jgi:small subunit ribosomal protein S20
LSAKKRVRQNAKRRLRNRDRKKTIRVEVKKLSALIAAGDKQAAITELSNAQKILDRLSTRGAVHKNTAARKKAQLAKQINALKAK